VKVWTVCPFPGVDVVPPVALNAALTVNHAVPFQHSTAEVVVLKITVPVAGVAGRVPVVTVPNSTEFAFNTDIYPLCIQILVLFIHLKKTMQIQPNIE
jgi:hypothetical protein